MPAPSSTAQLAAYPPIDLKLERAEGCELIDTSGKRYLDLYGGHCVCLLGHNPPALRDALLDQMGRITFYSTALDLTQREDAAQALAAYAGDGFGKVFFVNSGAEANENAIKLACAATGRRRVACVEGSFHGRTAGTDCVTGDRKRAIHYPNAPFDVSWIAFGDVQELSAVLSAGDVACVILEPVQSMAGCRVHPPEFVEKLNELRKAHGTLVVADEVQGGFGRCIANFSSQAIGMHADILTCAKGLGAGFPIGAIVVRNDLAERAPKGYFGSTFGGGPLAAVSALTVLREIQNPGFIDNVRAVSAELDRCAALPGVVELWGLGLLRGIRLDRPVGEVKKALLARGYIVGGANDPQVLRLLPPLTLTVSQMQGFVSTLADVLGG